MRKKYTSRHIRHQKQNRFKIYGLLALLTILLIVFLAKFPLLSEPKKQYAVKSNGEVKKVPASTEAGEIKKLSSRPSLKIPKRALRMSSPQMNLLKSGF